MEHFLNVKNFKSPKKVMEFKNFKTMMVSFFRESRKRTAESFFQYQKLKSSKEVMKFSLSFKTFKSL